MTSLRSKIARAIYETYREISNMGEPPWEALCGSIREENHLQEADAVLAVIDVADAVVTVEQIRDEIAGHPIGSGYYRTAVAVDEAREIAESVHALLTGEEA